MRQEKKASEQIQEWLNTLVKLSFIKGNRDFADLRYEEEDNTSLSTLILAAIKGLLRKHTLYIPPEVL